MAYVAPAGTPITLREICRGVFAGLSDGRVTSRLRGGLSACAGTDHAWSFVSGRAAMTVALRALSALAGPERRHVVVPAYTCYSVPAAVERAGLVPLPCDIDPRTLSLDLDRLERACTGSVLAIVTANLFGIPNDLVAIERVARARGPFMLDDAAQALGARLGGHPVGGFGDLGVYSFDRGKNISTMQGGALVGRSGEVANSVENAWHGLPAATRADTFASISRLAPYAMLLRPSRYGFVMRMPLLRLGETRYELRYPITKLSPGLEGLALDQLARVAALQQARSANARLLRAALEDLPGVSFVDVPPSGEPAYPRFPVRIASQEMRGAILAALRQSGIGASGFYPEALVDVPQVAVHMPPSTGQFHGAREIARTVLTLPTHPYVPADLATRVREIFLAVVTSAGSARRLVATASPDRKNRCG